MRWIKIALFSIGGVLLLLLLSSYLFLGSIVAAGIRNVGPMLTKTTMTVSSVTLSPITGRCRIRGFEIGNPAGFKAPLAVKLKDFRVRVSPTSLASDVIQIRSVSIEGAEITKEGNNLNVIQKNVQSFVPADAESKKASKPKKLIIDDLWIKDAKANVEILGGMKTVSLSDIHLTNIGRAQGGVAPDKAVGAVLDSLMGGVTAGIAGAGKAVSHEAGKVGAGLKGLFKKK
ncbi:MAG: hypothetical protein V1495_11015 [Pseudomonadota bacterium]